MTNCPGECNIDGSSVSFSNFALKDANPPTTTVRQHQSLKDEHGAPLNICYFKQLGEDRIKTPREVWRKIVDELLTTEVCAMMWKPKSKLQKAKTAAEAMDLVNDLDEAVS